MSLSRRLITVAACAAAVAVSAAPANAAPHRASNATQVRASASGLQPNVAKTNYGAGYFSYPGAGNIASASVTFRMPATWSCHRPGDKEWLSPGIWIYDSNGELSQFSGVEFNCNAGATFQGGVLCVDSYAACDDTLVVNPSDRVVASLYESSTQTVATVHDLTTDQRASISAAPVTNDTTVFIGDEGPALASSGAVTNVPTFTHVAFSSAQVNGLYLGDWSPVHYNLATHGGVLQEKSGLLGANGTAFTTTFVHN